MDGLILAAGCGSRLGTLAPKCLAEVGGRSLLSLQLDALRGAGVEGVTVVVGYRHEEIRAAAPGGVTFIHNERFAETNSMYSFELARSAVRGSVVVLNSDVLFPAALLERVLDSGGSALAFDSGSGQDAEHMKVQLRDGQLVTMSKHLPPELTDGENVGLLHLSAAAAQASFAAAAELVRRGHKRGWLAQAVSAVAGTHPIAGVDVGGLPWVEIDYPNDLEHARERVWPAIESSARAVQGSRLPAMAGPFNAQRMAVAG